MVRGAVVVKEAVFAVPGDLATPTGGYGYARRIIAEVTALGWRLEVLNLGEGFPWPTAGARAVAAERLALLPPDRPIVVDGLAFGVLPEAAEVLRESHALIALVHHPLALESGLSAAQSAALRASERAALACARHVVTSSATTGRLLVSDYGVAPERLSVVEPGTDPPQTRADEPGSGRVTPARSRASSDALGTRTIELPRWPLASLASAATRSHGSDSGVELLAVGAVVPRKGYDLLVAALAGLKDLPWRLVIAGDGGRSPETFAQLEADIARLGLADRVALRGAVSADQLASLYESSDLFVLPSRYEGYGMAYTEAIAHGLPVVGTTAGAIPETVPADAGVLVAPDDVAALAAVLRHLIENPHERERLAAGARAVRFPSWAEQAALFGRVLERFALERLA
jgi:glycosyltransferase involved in cell wall biosynthesis